MDINNKKLKFGTAGIRAKRDELTPKETYEIVFKIAQFFGNRVVIARDARNNGRALLNAVEAALLYLGKEVHSIGISPTPTTQYYLEKNGMDMGIVITASHNPPEWNGIKVIKSNNVVLSKEEGNPLLERPSEDKINPKNEVKYEDANTQHAIAMKKYINKKDLEDIKMVVDYGNGVGKLVFGKFLDMLNVKREEINEKLDGNFPGRNSEPTEKNLEELIRIMRNGEYDIGIAFDGDADRVVFVDEKGRFVSGDKAFAILSKYVLKEGKEADFNKIIVSTVATSRIVEDIAKEENASIHYVKVGTTYIAQGIIDTKAIVGGEEAGGIIYPKEHLGKDGMLSAVLMLRYMKKYNKKLGEMVDALPKYYSTKEKLAIKSSEKTNFMKKFLNYAKEAYKEGKINEVDGIRVDFRDYWFIVRPSGTEDYIRFFIEARSKSKLEEIKSELYVEAERLIDKLK